MPTPETVQVLELVRLAIILPGWLLAVGLLAEALVDRQAIQATGPSRLLGYMAEASVVQEAVRLVIQEIWLIYGLTGLWLLPSFATEPTNYYAWLVAFTGMAIPLLVTASSLYGWAMRRRVRRYTGRR